MRQMEQTQSRPNRRTRLALLAYVLVIIVCSVYRLAFSLTPDQRQFKEELLAKFSHDKIVALSDLNFFKPYDAVCVFHAYEVALTHTKDGKYDLKRIFGPIDYSMFENDIITTYSESYAYTGFYLAKSGKLVRRVSDPFPPGIYIEPSLDASHRVGCVRPEDVCLRMEAIKIAGETIVGYGLCADLRRT